MPTELIKTQRKIPRAWLRLILVAFPLLLLVGFEGVLRLGGYGFATGFFLQRHFNGQAVLTDNPEFGKRFFPPGLTRLPKPMIIPAQKSQESLRVCVFGESAAMGDPDTKFGLPRTIEILLRERFPHRRIELVTAAMVAINSHVLVPIARDCVPCQADVWVVYMGNNEMIGPFGAISVSGLRTPPLSLIRASLAARTLRVGQLLDDAIRWLRRKGQGPITWEGMAMWKECRIRDQDPTAQRVYHYFEDNLQRIIEIGRGAGIPLIVCTVANNLRDCAPFASLHSQKLAPAVLDQWDEIYQKGIRFERQQEFVEANACYQRALTIDPQFAETSFRAGRCSLTLGEASAAFQHFREAREFDALPFRANDRINEIIRHCATADAASGVHLLDAEQLFAMASPHGIIGHEYFYEHVHLNPAGNYLLGRAVAEQITSLLHLSDEQATAPSFGNQAPSDRVRSSGEAWLTEPDCLKALGFTDWNRQDILRQVLERITQSPFTEQFNQAERVLALREEVEPYRSATKPVQLRRAIRQVAEPVERWPYDADLRWNLAQLLDIARELPSAEEQWRATIRLQPHAYLSYFNLGKLLDGEGRKTEAEQLYHQCLQQYPDCFEARLALGALLLDQGKFLAAIDHLRRAAVLRPRSPEAHSALSLALERLKSAQ